MVRKMFVIRIVTAVFLSFLFFDACSQKQLVLMKRQTVLLRLYPGDEITLKVKGSSGKRVSYINNLFDDAILIHKDTVPFEKIERIYFDQQKFHNRLGINLMVAGATLFLIDQLNYTVIQGNEASLDSWVSRTSLTAVGVGLPLWLAKKKSQRIDGRYRLVTIQQTSPFYKPDLRKTIDY